MQLCHGKLPPVRRIAPGDRIVYYSPTVTFGGKDRLMAFTAIGTVRDGEPYRVDMGNGVLAWRRDVVWEPAGEAPIKPLLEVLDLTAGRPNWGYQLRFGLLGLSERDFGMIAKAMAAARIDSPAPPP